MEERSIIVTLFAQQPESVSAKMILTKQKKKKARYVYILNGYCYKN